MEWEHVFFESTALIGLQLILLHWNSTSFMESSCYLVDFHLYTVCVPFLFQSTFITCFIKLPTFMPETAVSCAWLKIQISSKHVFFSCCVSHGQFLERNSQPRWAGDEGGRFLFLPESFRKFHGTFLQIMIRWGPASSFALGKPPELPLGISPKRSVRIYCAKGLRMMRIPLRKKKTAWKRTGARWVAKGFGYHIYEYIHLDCQSKISQIQKVASDTRCLP